MAPTAPQSYTGEEAASAAEYAVYVMKVEGNQVGVPEVGVKELPASVRQTLDTMSSKHVAADRDSMEEVLMALGMSSGDCFGRVNGAEIFTQIDERIIKLDKAQKTASPLL